MERANDLPFCKNDVDLMERSLQNGLNIENHDITTCGNGTVTKHDFVESLSRNATITNPEDTLIFYFSGHGTNISQQHHLVLSDTLISTNELILNLEISLSS